MNGDFVISFTNETIRRMRLTILPDDTDTRGIIEGYILSGISYLNGMAGSDVDFENDRLAYELLYNYVFYSFQDSLDGYAKAYRSELIRLRLMYAAGGGESNAST